MPHLRNRAIALVTVVNEDVGLPVRRLAEQAIAIPKIVDRSAFRVFAKSAAEYVVGEVDEFGGGSGTSIGVSNTGAPQPVLKVPR